MVSLYALFTPAGDGPTLFEGSDKVVHAALFALLAGTARWRFGPSPTALVLIALYAAVSELVQGIALSSRSGDPLDLLADVVGATVGWLVAAWLLSRPPAPDRP